MKTIFLMLVAACGITLGYAQDVSETWDHTIEVNSSQETFDQARHHAYSVVVYEASENAVRKLVLDEIKLRTSEKATKKAITEGLKVDIPALQEDAVTLKVKTDADKNNDEVTVYAAFMNEGVDINPQDHPEGDKAAKEVMRNLSVMLNQSVVTAQIVNAEKELKQLQNRQSAFENQRAKLDNAIETSQTTTARLEDENAKLQIKLEAAQATATSKQALSEASTATEKDIKKYAKAKKDVADIESKIIKNNQLISKHQKNVSDAEADIPEKDQLVTDAIAEVEAMQARIVKLNAKYDSIK